MKLIGAERLAKFNTGFQAVFERGVGLAPTQHERIAMKVVSKGASEDYGWLAELPGVREWIGPRQLQNLSAYTYSLRNRKFELTVRVNADDIDDDRLGLYTPRFEQMGRATGAFAGQLVFEAVKNAFTTPCYDGQNFFDTAHPVKDEKGATINVANTDGGGAGIPWLLIDSTQAVKPFILQMRSEFDFTKIEDAKDPHVFHNDEWLYGTKARMNVGYGMWQFAFGSKNPLTSASYATARAAMLNMIADGGRPIGVMPDLLLVPPAYESVARKLMLNEQGTNGETNEWKGTAEVVVCPWLR